ncbi:MAG: 4-amino-4-deoxychorismate lyase [Chitinophagales bacterium]
MTVLVNGKQNPQTSVSDRGFLYGQSVFETIAVINSKSCLLDLHINRLQRGCDVLSIPLDTKILREEIQSLIKDQERAVLRVTISMGVGGRGYLNPQSPVPTRVLSLHDYPNHPTSNWDEGITLGVADIRLSHQPMLAGIKHGNRLEQVIARSQWHDNWHEALLLDQQGTVVEATQSNVFIVNADQLITPSLQLAGVEGVAREYVMSQAHKLGLQVKIMSLSIDHIEAADEVFLTNSVIGLWPVKQLNSKCYTDHRNSHKLLKLLIKNEVIPDYKT